MLELSGSVEEIVFTNEDNGYTVCVIDYDGKPVTLVGIMPLLAEGEIITARGSWVNHEVFGLQFKVDSFEKKLPSDTESICRFLASGFIKGIGPVTARRIVERYGEDSFDVLENNPEWLADIKGMTQKRAAAAGEDFRAKFGMRTVMLFCGEYFGAATSLKIYKKYGAAAVDIIKQNPYVLCDDIQGIGFEKVDSVALSLGVETDNPERLKNGIKSFLMAAAYKAGHCYLERSVLVEEAALRLQVSEALIDRTLNSLEELKQILDNLGIEYEEAEGEAAFYGPKLDIQYKNVWGKEDTIITVQVDFQLAEKFGMTYIDKDGSKKYPIVIHRTSIGCYERTLAMLIEKYAGAFPTWLAPVQIKILPISDRHVEYADKLLEKFRNANFRVEVDDRNEKIGYKIREAQLEKVPYMLVIGDKEVESGMVGVRSRKEGDLGAILVEEFIEKVRKEVENYER